MPNCIEISTGFEPSHAAMMAESVKMMSIVPLNGSNYTTWKVLCTMVLRKTECGVS